MAVEESLNQILKEMWRLDEKELNGDVLTIEEKDFYNNYLPIIKEYYTKNNLYWQSKKNENIL